MSGIWVNYIVAVVLIAHGVGHVLGLAPIFGIQLSPSHSADSWLLSGILGDTVVRVLGAILWTAAAVGFVCAGLGLLGWIVPQEWWRSLAIWSAVLSLIGLILFLNAFPMTFPNKLGVIVVDVGVLVGLLIFNWTPNS